MGKKQAEIKVTRKDLDKILEEQETRSQEATWNGIQFHVTRTIPLPRALRLARDAAESCFLDEGENRYLPEMMEFSFRNAVIEAYTDLKLPEDVQARYRALYETDLYHIVIDLVDLAQLDELRGAVAEKVAALRWSQERAAREKIHDLTRALEDVTRQIERLFDGLTRDDIRELIHAAGGADQSEIAAAYLRQKDRPEDGQK